MLQNILGSYIQEHYVHYITYNNSLPFSDSIVFENQAFRLFRVYYLID